MSETTTTRTSPEASEPRADVQSGATDIDANGLTSEEWAAHVARVKEARGKFAHLFSSAEERMGRKQEEIDLEEEQSQRRVGSTPE
jgi:hypothetical protein